MNVSFYVKAGEKTGMGHIYRCLALADKLTALGATCHFFSYGLAARMATDAGYGLRQFLEFDDVWVADLEGGVPPARAQEMRERSGTFVILNGVGYPDGDPGRLVADLVFYQGVTDRPHKLDWSGFRGAWFEGVEWVILRDGIVRRWRETYHEPFPRVVVVGGGADIGGVSRRVMGAIDYHRYDVRVVVGAASPDGDGWPNEVAVVKNPPDFFKHLDWADVAVVSYGMTAFECLASGLPTVALSITPDHKASADLVQQRSRYSLFSVGMVDEVTDEDIQDAVEVALLSTGQMSGMALEFCDGMGAARAAEKIMEVAGVG